MKALEMTFEQFEIAVIEGIDDDWHDDKLKWLYDKDNNISEEVDGLIRLMWMMDTLVPFAIIYLRNFRDDFLERNYDGPPDGEAWSGGFADNH